MNLTIDIPRSRSSRSQSISQSRNQSRGRLTPTKQTSIDRKHKLLGIRNPESFESVSDWLDDTLSKVSNLPVATEDNPFGTKWLNVKKTKVKAANKIKTFYKKYKKNKDENKGGKTKKKRISKKKSYTKIGYY